MNNRSNAVQRALEQRIVQRAIETRAPLLARPLDRYAEDEGLTWSQLAAEIGCDTSRLNRIALCRQPREGRLLDDVRAIAEDADLAERLIPLLRRLQALDALRAASPVAARSLLAAQDRETSEGPEDEDDAG